MHQRHPTMPFQTKEEEDEEVINALTTLKEHVLNAMILLSSPVTWQLHVPDIKC